MISQRHSLFILFFLAIYTVSVIPAFSTDKQNEDIQVIRERLEGNRYDTIRGQVILNTSMETIREILTDGNACIHWMHKCKEGRVLKINAERTHGFVYFVYHAPKLPWYLFMAPKPKDRDMVLKLDLEDDPVTGGIYFNLINIDPEKEEALADLPDPFNRELVQVNILDIKWAVMPQEGGRLEVKLEVYSDPNHPGKDLGIIDKYTYEMVKKTLENIRNISNERRKK